MEVKDLQRGDLIQIGVSSWRVERVTDQSVWFMKGRPVFRDQVEKILEHSLTCVFRGEEQLNVGGK